MVEKVDVAVIGGGPAGLSAAIQLRRSGLGVLLFEKGELGGLARNANLIENYPGFPEGVPGTELVRLFVEQFKRYDIQTIHEEVKLLSYEEGAFIIDTGGRRECFNAVVIATGTKPKRLAELEKAGVGRNIFYEVHELFGIRRERIAVVGGGDAAFDSALLLSEGNEVLIFDRSAEPRCLPLLFERAAKRRDISYFGGVDIVDVKVSDMLFLECRDGEGRSENYEVSYILAAVGREPALDFVDEKIDIETLCRDGRCFLAGDVRNGRYRQVSIAVGDGVRAAMKIAERIRGSE